MAHAQYATRTRTVEETVVVLELTEDEADELRDALGESDGTPTRVRILAALQKPEPPKAEEPANTFEYDGAVYDLDAKYEDRDGDRWSFSPVQLDATGVPRGRYRDRAEYEEVYNLAKVVDDFGPLIKVTP
ncbi:phiSA1p31-related protein [Streptomyces bikiniensis]|uniref:PhiSA1p31-related protein n=1 Tax=Streptomyces bikiniensis TaxID=1896 RepID=A0ABW8D5N0_STRBI